MERDSKVVGSALIGQEFTNEGYFHGRPSATVTPDPNDPAKAVPAPGNAARCGGSDLGPDSEALIERIQRDIEKLKQENPSAQVPGDLVTTSGSGLDPDISPEAALFQVPRVARARNLPEIRCGSLSPKDAGDRFAGLFRKPRVNVLELNLVSTARPLCFDRIYPCIHVLLADPPCYAQPPEQIRRGDDNEKSSIWMGRQAPNDDASRKRTM